MKCNSVICMIEVLHVIAGPKGAVYFYFRIASCFSTLMYDMNYQSQQQITHNFSFLLQHFHTFFVRLRVPQGQVESDKGCDERGAGETSGEAEGADGEAAAAFIAQI